MNVFVTRLRERADQLGLAHAEVARRAGLSERRYGNYVVGIREPDLATLVRIADALRTTPDLLVGVTDPKPNSPRSLLLDRLSSAAQTMSDDDLESAIIQVEVVVSRRRAR